MEDLTKLTLDEINILKASLQEKLLGLKEVKTISALQERKSIEGELNMINFMKASLEEADKVEEVKEEVKEEIKVEDVKDEDSKEDDQVEDVTDTDTGDKSDTTVEGVSEAQIVDDVNTPSEGATIENKPEVVMASYDGERVNADNARELFTHGKVTRRAMIKGFDEYGLSAEKMTEKIMAINTPGLDTTKMQTQFVKASFCGPAEQIREPLSCGTYDRKILNLFRNFPIKGMTIEYQGRHDASASVGEVDLTVDPIANKCTNTYECVENFTKNMREYKACFTMNEQSAFSNDLALEALISDANGYFSAKADGMLLEDIIASSIKTTFTAGGRGYADVAIAVATALELVEQSSPLITVDNSYVALLPKSMLKYAVADSYARAFSTADAQSYAEQLFGAFGIRVAVYDDFIDPTHTVQALPDPTAPATVLTPRNAWNIQLINPDAAFVATRTENNLGIEEVAPSATELANNQKTFFGRGYELLGVVGCTAWINIDIEKLCLGGSVAPAALCA